MATFPVKLGIRCTDILLDQAFALIEEPPPGHCPAYDYREKNAHPSGICIPTICTEHLTRRFRDLTAVDDVNLRVARGPFLAFSDPTRLENPRPSRC
jgi:hypothetical protein